MNFKVRLLLSDLLGKKSRRKSNINVDNFSIDETGKTTIQLNMKGPIDDPKISLDKIKIRTDVFNEIKKESQKVKEILEEKIFDKSNNSKLKDNEKSESEFEIEWDDEKLKNKFLQTKTKMEVHTFYGAIIISAVHLFNKNFRKILRRIYQFFITIYRDFKTK